MENKVLSKDFSFFEIQIHSLKFLRIYFHHLSIISHSYPMIFPRIPVLFPVHSLFFINDNGQCELTER